MRARPEVRCHGARLDCQSPADSRDRNSETERDAITGDVERVLGGVERTLGGIGN